MKELKFNNKDGSLTRYALACGYIQEFKKNNVRLTLYTEGCVVQVRAFDHGQECKRLFWETFESNELTKAKKFYNRFKSSLKRTV